MNSQARNEMEKGLLGKGEGKLCPVGTHDAMCVQIVDLGIIGGQWGDKYWFKMVFEIEDEEDKENPYLIAYRIPFSLHPKSNFRKMLVKWRTRDFTETETSEYLANPDLLFTRLLGKGCMVSVIENSKGDKIYHNVSDILNLKQARWFEPKTELVYFTVEDDFPVNKDNQETLRKLPEWVQRETLEKNSVIKDVYAKHKLYVPTFEQWMQGNASSDTPPPVEEPTQSNEPDVNDEIPF